MDPICYKTQFCRFYSEGRCSKGSTCGFAHSQAELRNVPDLRCTSLCFKINKAGGCRDPHCRFAHSATELRPRCIDVSSEQARLIDYAEEVLSPHEGDNARRVAPTSGMADDYHKSKHMEDKDRSRAAAYNSVAKGAGTVRWIRVDVGPMADDVDEGIQPLRQEVDDYIFCQPDARSSGEDEPMEPICHKTQLCRFYDLGRCRKGSKCAFAHGQAELRPLLDLRCTSFCLKLTKDGSCMDPQCRYAHSVEELRPRRTNASHEQTRRTNYTGEAVPTSEEFNAWRVASPTGMASDYAESTKMENRDPSHVAAYNRVAKGVGAGPWIRMDAEAMAENIADGMQQLCPEVKERTRLRSEAAMFKPVATFVQVAPLSLGMEAPKAIAFLPLERRPMVDMYEQQNNFAYDTFPCEAEYMDNKSSFTESTKDDSPEAESSYEEATPHEKFDDVSSEEVPHDAHEGLDNFAMLCQHLKATTCVRNTFVDQDDCSIPLRRVASAPPCLFPLHAT